MASPPSGQTPPPPVSMTSLPPHTKPFVAQSAPIKPPVLASDILREEVAPISPAKRAIRVWLFAFAATFALAAVGAKLGIGLVHDGDDAFIGALTTSALAMTAALVSLRYSVRAALAALAGLVPLALGAFGLGPLAAFGGEGALPSVTAIALVTLLPAALVFRARYRAFAGARTALAIALAASAPALVFLTLAAFDSGAPLAFRVASGVSAASALTALLGFMGPETSAGCSQWAAVIVIAHTARLTLHAIDAAWAGNTHDMASYGAAALGELIASTLVTFALFQILAATLSGLARQVDVHRIVGASAMSDAPPGSSVRAPQISERD